MTKSDYQLFTMLNNLNDVQISTDDELYAAEMLTRLSMDNSNWDANPSINHNASINHHASASGSPLFSFQSPRYHPPPMQQQSIDDLRAHSITQPIHPAQVAEAGTRSITDTYSSSVRTGVANTPAPLPTHASYPNLGSAANPEIVMQDQHFTRGTGTGTGRARETRRARGRGQGRGVSGNNPQPCEYGNQMVGMGYDSPYMEPGNIPGRLPPYDQFQPAVFGSRGSGIAPFRSFNPFDPPRAPDGMPLQPSIHPGQARFPQYSPNMIPQGGSGFMPQYQQPPPHALRRERSFLPHHYQPPPMPPAGGFGYGNFPSPQPFCSGPAGSHMNFNNQNRPFTPRQLSPPRGGRRLTREEAAQVLLDLAGPYKRVLTPDPFRASWGRFAPTVPVDTSSASLLTVSPRGTVHNEFRGTNAQQIDHTIVALRNRAITPNVASAGSSGYTPQGNYGSPNAGIAAPDKKSPQHHNSSAGLNEKGKEKDDPIVIDDNGMMDEDVEMMDSIIVQPMKLKIEGGEV